MDSSFQVSDEELEKWSTDTNCIEMEACAKALAKRVTAREAREVARQAALVVETQRLLERRKELAENPFDPRTEVSADAEYIASRIVKHLWILFVLLPFVVFVMLALIGNMK